MCVMDLIRDISFLSLFEEEKKSTRDGRREHGCQVALATERELRKNTYACDFTKCVALSMLQLNPLHTVHFRTSRNHAPAPDEIDVKLNGRSALLTASPCISREGRQSARGLRHGRRYPALVPSEQGRISKRMSGSAVYSRKSVGGLWFCMFLLGTGFLHQQTMASMKVECLMHEDCKPGQFCAYVPNIDSYEGWRFATSTCKACSQCVCHFSSTTNRCPQERLVFLHTEAPVFQLI